MQLNQVSTNNQYPVIAPLPQSDVPGPINQLLSDALAVVLSNANEPSLSAAKLVSKKWNEMIVNNHDYLGLSDVCSQLKHKVAFGPEDWAKHMGISISDEDIQAAYAILPDNIEQILNSPCPVSPESGALVKDTHMLVYIPPSINGKDINGDKITKKITLSSLGELAEKLLDKEDNPRKVAGYSFIWDQALKQLDKPVEEAHWVLMMKDVLGGMDTVNGSRNKPFTVQQELVKKLAQESGEDYVVPKTLEAVAAIISQFLKTNEHLFGRGEQLWTYTRCEENISDCRVVVGGFAPAGLRVRISSDHDRNGVAALRKFFFRS